MAKLTDRRRRFVTEYLVDLNATAAAIRAGYSEKTACEQGSRLLANVKVQEEIQKRQKGLQRELEISQKKVLQELAAVAFANGSDFATINRSGRVCLIPTCELSEQKKKAIASIKEGQYGTEVKLYDKVRALELLGRHLGVFYAKGGATLPVTENNLLEAIMNIEEIDASDLPEVE